MDRTFVHIVRDVDECFDTTYEYDAVLEEKSEMFIEMTIHEEAGFWLSANREGCLHLARFFAELGLRNHEDGYHIHVNQNFFSSGKPPEFSFERCDHPAPGLEH
jgi:hypothetical protein